MSKFKSLVDSSVKQAEAEVSKYWNEVNILEKTLEKGKNDPSFVFYEGPPTANGNPGIHHVIARTLKDSVCRYKTMNGYQVKRKAGWDTHGLPVEIQVEKELGLSDKQQIEAYGIDKFNEKCRDSVFSFEKQWREMTERMAYEIDLDNPYITLDNNYIESVWWILDKFNKEGYIYEGHKILPYCPRCGTGLASHEVAQGYKEVKNNTVIAKFKRVDADEYFLAWTTTPWTLPSNVALTVGPEVDYVKVKQNDEVYYVAKALANKVLGEDYEVLAEMKGKDLEHVEYEQLMPFVTTEEKAFFVTCGDYVTTEDGTGIVHTAPAFGEDDYNLGRKYNLPVLQPVDESGKFTATPWEGKFVMEEGVDVEIIKWLAHENKLFSKEKVAHNYPHCWRCQTPLVYYAKPSWYIEMTRLKDQLIANNNTVEWYPNFVGEGRFGNWLENLNDWAISRSRYWGTPLNIWKCECGHKQSVGSRAELAEKAIEDVNPETVELHRPYVDDIHLKCDCCGKPMTRVTEVIDCWFDSGSMPFAQHHYPFENKENFEELFPADFICEGIDQTRGWFYSLLAISTFVMGKAPYKRVLVNDLVLDKEGKKMSKSRGNTVNPFELFDQYGADALRWYLLYVSPPWTPTRFDVDGLKEVQSKFLGTMKNVYNFFTLYANTDEVNPKDFFVDYKNRPELDRWILSKFNNLKKEVEENLEIFELNKTVRMIQDFINEDLSNWYIRRSRRRFWATELTEDKKSVYNTTYEILTELCQLIAPFAPYISEEIYRNLTGEVSVHLSNYPKANLELINPELEEKMDLAYKIVKLGRSARNGANIKNRQPLSKMLLSTSELPEYYGDIIKDELNIKEVELGADLSKYVNFEIKPNLPVLGRAYGKLIPAIRKEIASRNQMELAQKIQNGGVEVITVDGNEIELNAENLLVTMQGLEGFAFAGEGSVGVVLDTTITDELREEGHVREIISKIQNMRKESGFEVADKITLYVAENDMLLDVIKKFEDVIKKETLTEEVVYNGNADYSEAKVNGEILKMAVSKRA